MRVVDTYRNTTLSADGRLDERSQGDQAAHTCFIAIELASHETACLGRAAPHLANVGCAKRACFLPSEEASREILSQSRRQPSFML